MLQHRTFRKHHLVIRFDIRGWVCPWDGSSHRKSRSAIHGGLSDSFSAILLPVKTTKVDIPPSMPRQEAQRAAIRCQDSLERLDLIEASTMVVVGTKDRLIRPSSSEVMADRIPHGRLPRIENGSHTLNLEMGPLFNPVILSFLDNE